MPKILLLDIETSPALCWVWKLHKVNIGIDQIEEPSQILCWAAKWYGERGIYYADQRGGRKKMLSEMHALMSQADCFATYNGDRFDLGRLEGEFIEQRLPPTPPVASVDLYKKVANLGYISAKLAYVGPHLKIGKKVKHAGFDLWRGCMRGDESSWRKMKAYNIQDVRLTGELYTLLRPYIRNHPFMGVGGGELHECPTCTSTRNQSRGNRRTRSFLIQRLQCLDCGAWFNGKRSQVKAAA